MDHRIEGLRDLPEEEKHPVLDPDRSPPRIGSLSNRRRVRRAQRGTRDSCGPTPGSASRFRFLLPHPRGLHSDVDCPYSIVGEKVEKSLEPLLATPTTDGEILLGKGISAFLPPIAAIWGGSAVFMVLMDLVTRGTLGYNFFPNWNAGIVLSLVVPPAAIMSVEWNGIISARVSDVRVAMQLGARVALPFGGIYVSGELN